MLQDRTDGATVKLRQQDHKRDAGPKVETLRSLSRNDWRVARRVASRVNLTWLHARSSGTISSSRCQITRTIKRSIGSFDMYEFVFCGRAFNECFHQSRDHQLADQPKPSRSIERWWSQTGSNRRPPACKAGALPTELWPRYSTVRQQRREMVGLGRFELPTSRLSSARSNQLSYRPNF